MKFFWENIFYICIQINKQPIKGIRYLSIHQSSIPARIYIRRICSEKGQEELIAALLQSTTRGRLELFGLNLQSSAFFKKKLKSNNEFFISSKASAGLHNGVTAVIKGTAHLHFVCSISCRWGKMAQKSFFVFSMKLSSVLNASEKSFRLWFFRLQKRVDLAMSRWCVKICGLLKSILLWQIRQSRRHSRRRMMVSPCQYQFAFNLFFID